LRDHRPGYASPGDRGVHELRRHGALRGFRPRSELCADRASLWRVAPEHGSEPVAGQLFHAARARRVRLADVGEPVPLPSPGTQTGIASGGVTSGSGRRLDRPRPHFHAFAAKKTQPLQLWLTRRCTTTAPRMRALSQEDGEAIEFATQARRTTFTCLG